MSKPILIINELDAERLDTLLAQPAFANTPVADALNEELDRAEICRRANPRRRGHDEQQGALYRR